MNINKKLLKKVLKYSNYKFIQRKILNIKKINILEFGVREGLSTSMFLSLCEKNIGKLISVEIINRRTFSKILEIYSKNLENFSLEFCFDNSGMTMIKKKNNLNLIQPKIIYNSELKKKAF